MAGYVLVAREHSKRRPHVYGQASEWFQWTGRKDTRRKEGGGNWISNTWNKQEEMGLKAEANKNNLTFPLKLDIVFPFSSGLLD